MSSQFATSSHLLLRAVHRGPAPGGGGVQRAQRADHRGASARVPRTVRVRAPPGPARAFHVRREPARALRAHAHFRLLLQGICTSTQPLALVLL